MPVIGNAVNFMTREIAGPSRIVDEVAVVSGAETSQDNQYSGLSLEQALPVLLDLISRAQSSD